MGGAKGYDTLYRDLGCSAIVVIATTILWGWHPCVALAVFLLHWGAFATYWKHLFGKITMWFSGLMVGFALYPIVFIDPELYKIVIIRAVALAIIWEFINRYLPEHIFIWHRDIVEEFSRYFSSL